MAIRLKFGTRGIGVALGVREGVDVNMAARGMSVKVCVADRRDAGVSVGIPEEGMQPTNKNRIRVQKP